MAKRSDSVVAADPSEEAAQRLQQAEQLVAALAQPGSAAQLKAAQAQAKALLKPLRAQRAFAAVLSLAEPLSRLDPGDVRIQLAYAQALTDSGSVVPALALSTQLAEALQPTDPVWAEAWGAVGRGCKQVFADATRAQAGTAPPHARAALQRAIEAYGKPYRADPVRHHWHGVNLLALMSRAAREGLDAKVGRLDASALAKRLAKSLDQQPAGQLDRWMLASRAEVALGQALISGDAQDAQTLNTHLARYLQAPGLEAFELASTLRQFTEIWDLDRLKPRSRGSALKSSAQVAWAQGLVDVMRARLLQLPGGMVAMTSSQLAAAAKRPVVASAAAVQSTAGASGTQLEALLGNTQAKPMSWWTGGLQVARSVALIRRRMGPRLGSGFLVRAGDLGLKQEPDELLLLTNYHVVNREGVAKGVRPEQAEVVFEAVDATRALAVAELLWQSPVETHDAALLRLAELPAGLTPLSIARSLPPRPPAGAKEEDKPRVYVIGHPGGRELSISLSDNALIDHEAPPDGTPAHEGVWRVHYRAPTEGGSSGSPVFDENDWSVIALHHMGGRFGMPKLNGQAGTYAANEGLALVALAAALCRELEPVAD